MSNKLFIAIEHNFEDLDTDDYSDDLGFPTKSPEKAWEIVSQIFDQKSTRIYSLELIGPVIKQKKRQKIKLCGPLISE